MNAIKKPVIQYPDIEDNCCVTQQELNDKCYTLEEAKTKLVKMVKEHFNKN